MAFSKFSPLAALATFALLGSVEAPAEAAVRTTIPIYLHNQTRTTPMTCRVTQIKKRGNRPARVSKLAEFDVTPMNDRPDAERNQPERFSVSVTRYGRNYARKDLYYPIQLHCELEGGGNSANHSPRWDNKDKAFSSHELTGSCRDGAYCSLSIRRRT